VLQNVPFPREFLQHVRHLLRPDGLFVCSVSNNSKRVPRFVANSGQAGLPPVNLNFWTCDSFRAFASLNGFRPLYLAPKRSLRDVAGARDNPIRFIWNQLGTILGFREGMTIYAVLTPID
jgi:SAM-dependent methyltransferase